MDSVKVALIGLGTVGTGVARLLTVERDLLRDQVGVDFELVGVADLDTETDRGLSLADGLLSSDAEGLIARDDVDVVIELIGGIEPARSFILTALEAGKHVVTANKHLLATKGKELFPAALAGGASIGFEASVCGGMPVITALRDGLLANRITELAGIVNGTSNYILTKMGDEGATYETALKEAQEAGFAEADPTFDVEGVDAAHKLTLLSALAFGGVPEFESLLIEGITRIEPDDFRYARELGYTLKLLAVGRTRGPGRVELRVHPTLVPVTDMLASVGGPMNAIRLIGDAVGPVMLYGQGAGMMPTASAVISDLAAVARGTAARSYSRLRFVRESDRPYEVISRDEIETRYFTHFLVRDEVRVLGRIAMALGEAGVSIDSCIQKEVKPDGSIPIVLMTHKALEKNFLGAIARIDSMDFVTSPTRFFRVEDGAQVAS